MEGEDQTAKVEEEAKENPQELVERKSAIINKINNGSYSKGYITQQVFAGKTCYDEKKLSCADKQLNQYGETVEPAGFGIGGLINCHNGHTAYELYSKTNFRCDCGNLKMNQQCVLNDEKEMYNELNKYSHNFFGRYGYCNEEYNGDVAMIQCVLCEDWFHFHHMNPDSTEKFNKLDESEIFGVLICRNGAAKQLDWLSKKTELILNYDEILKSQQIKDSKPVEDTESSEEKKDPVCCNQRKRARDQIGEGDGGQPNAKPESLINSNDSNEHVCLKTCSQDIERTEVKRRKLSNDESDFKEIVQEVKKCTLIDSNSISIEGYDLLLKESFYESLGSCENKSCIDYRQEILKIFK